VRLAGAAHCDRGGLEGAGHSISVMKKNESSREGRKTNIWLVKSVVVPRGGPSNNLSEPSAEI